MCLWRGRDQVQVSGFVVAEVRSSPAALVWPSSGPVQRLWGGRDHFKVGGFGVAELKSMSATSSSLLGSQLVAGVFVSVGAAGGLASPSPQSGAAGRLCTSLASFWLFLVLRHM